MIHSSDIEARASGAAGRNAESLPQEIQSFMRWRTRDFRNAVPPEGTTKGIWIANPPYGERLGETPELEPLYADIGHSWKKAFKGWRCAVFTGDPELGKRIGLKPDKRTPLFNGPIECRLLTFDVF